MKPSTNHPTPQKLASLDMRQDRSKSNENIGKTKQNNDKSKNHPEGSAIGQKRPKSNLD